MNQISFETTKLGLSISLIFLCYFIILFLYKCCSYDNISQISDYQSMVNQNKFKRIILILFIITMTLIINYISSIMTIIIFNNK